MSLYKTLNKQKMNSIRRLSLFVVGIWFIGALLGGALGLFNTPGKPPGLLAIFILLPIVGFITAYRISASFRSFAQSIDLKWLVGLHLWRFVGLGFVIGGLAGVLPGGFAWPEGLGDIIAATGALFLFILLRKGKTPKKWLLAWNIFGLIDLISAVTMGILYSNSSIGLLSAGTVTTGLMVRFPVNMIPTFFVPLFILLHLLTFRRISKLGSNEIYKSKQ
jgi:hypothetical protein